MGESEAVGPVPVPVRFTLCGLSLVLSEIVSLPVAGPLDFGEKVTSIVHEELTATVAPQLLVKEKSPVAETESRVSGAVPVFVSVTV